VVLHHIALDAGITLLDTGDFYGMGHNEMLIREALAGRNGDGVVISLKFGALRDVAGNWLGYDARPIAVNLPIRCDVSASTTSTSTGRRDSIPTCPSKTLSERSPTW
jgi:aryl-alcohol dehydrogenase-like predicted oxidoreductase